MMLSLLQRSEEYDDDDKFGEDETGVIDMSKIAPGLTRKPSIIKNKIQFMSKLAKMQRVLREERESILKIKFYNDNKLPQGILLEGKEAIDRFLAFKVYDAHNEMHPNYKNN